jgi:hypothetical protein
MLTAISRYHPPYGRDGAGLLADAMESYSRGRRDCPQTGWPSLAVTERTVANLVAEGLSNPPR